MLYLANKFSSKIIMLIDFKLTTSLCLHFLGLRLFDFRHLLLHLLLFFFLSLLLLLWFFLLFFLLDLRWSWGSGCWFAHNLFDFIIEFLDLFFDLLYADNWIFPSRFIFLLLIWINNPTSDPVHMAIPFLSFFRSNMLIFLILHYIKYTKLFSWVVLLMIDSSRYRSSVLSAWKVSYLLAMLLILFLMAVILSV